jgi:4-amino-4-deoxy-L-arabinose transferase-like glycosyltransferase
LKRLSCNIPSGWIQNSVTILDRRYSQYFKEDPALFFGWSSVIGAASLDQRKPSSKTAFLFGIAAGLAVSGKYVGIIASLCALAYVLIDQRKRVPIFYWVRSGPSF